ncbi:MAG TPA: hypothetical protein VE085_00420 [Burkholderiales bacterium]|nr:hypothetical protein [Burkholderiales bacterium]
MPKRPMLVRKSKQAVATSRVRAQLAQNRISLSRRQLSHSEDAVVAAASKIGAARWALRRPRKAGPG